MKKIFWIVISTTFLFATTNTYTQITKEVNNSSPHINETITFTITVKNISGGKRKIGMADAVETYTNYAQNYWGTTKNAFEIVNFSTNKPNKVNCSTNSNSLRKYVWCRTNNKVNNNFSFKVYIITKVKKSGQSCNTAWPYYKKWGSWHWENGSQKCLTAQESSPPQSDTFPGNYQCGIFPSALTTYQTLQINGQHPKLCGSDFVAAQTYNDSGHKLQCTQNTNCNNLQNCLRRDPPNHKLSPTLLTSNHSTNIPTSLHFTQNNYKNHNFSGGNKTLHFEPTDTYSNSSIKYMKLGNFTFDGNNYTLQFEPGDYYFDQLIFNGNNISFTLPHGGRVRIFIHHDLNFNKDNIHINENGSSHNLFIYVGGNFNLNGSGGGNGPKINGFLYVKGDANLNTNSNNFVVRGGITAEGNINIGGNNAHFYYIEPQSSSGYGACATASDTSDICYEDIQYSGFCMAFPFGCVGGFQCKKIIPIKNRSNTNLEDVRIYYNLQGMGGEFFGSCGVDPSGSCDTAYNIDFGSFGVLGSATEFNFSTPIPPNNSNEDVWVKKSGGYCLATDNLYVIYKKNGVTHKGKLQKCQPPINYHVGERDFAIRYKENLYGNIKVIGNTVLCPKNNGHCLYDSDVTNRSLDLRYIDVDNNTSTYDSSKAKLDIPNGKITTFVGLYTQGYVDNDVNINSVVNKIFQNIYLSIENRNKTYVIRPSVIDLIKNKSDGYSYSTFTEIKSLENIPTDLLNDWITVANVYANEGTEDSGLGNYGAWTLVVVYKDPNNQDTLRNITIFDGYKLVDKYHDDVTIPLSGFLTPYYGDIDSKLSLFVGEGDKNIPGDGLYFDNHDISHKNEGEDNAFYSIITGVPSRAPKLLNNNGIDIQNYNIGSTGLNLIQHGQESATIRLTSTQDRYYPSMIAFATQLYQPRVCYYVDKILDDQNNVVYEKKTFKKDIEPNKEYKISFWISNMKAHEDDQNIETAHKVKIFLRYNDFNYTNQSTYIKNISWSNFAHITDEKDSDIGEYLVSKNESDWRIGTGADAQNGGTLEPNFDFNDNTKKVFAKIRGKILVDQNMSSINLDNTFSFYATYETNSITLDKPLKIVKCVEFNLTAGVSTPPVGSFNIVNKNFTGESDPVDVNSTQNALFTQIVGAPFEVTILSLGQKSGSVYPLTSTTKDINISLITTPNYASCQNEECKQNLCDNAPLQELLASNIHFNGKKQNITLTIHKALQKASLRVDYTENGSIKHACSFDSFAIRPATYTLSFHNSYLVGGKAEPLDINATTFQSTNLVSTYTNIAYLEVNASKRPSCPTTATDSSLNINFTNGQANSIIVQTTNIGDYNFTITDNSWTTIDSSTAKSDNPSFFDCIKESNTTTKDSYGRIGCLVRSSEQVRFHPKDFKIDFDISGFNNHSIAYIASDPSMSANIDINITARLENNATATYYSSGCYAHDVNFTLTLTHNRPLRWGNFANRIHFYTMPQYTLPITSHTFRVKEGNFTSGIASIHLKYNFDRNKTIPDYPFNSAKNDFNISVQEYNGLTKGEDFDRNSDKNLTFVYGRVHGADESINLFKTREGNVTLTYEIFDPLLADGTRRSQNDGIAVLNGLPGSIDSINWVINTKHTNENMGKIYQIRHKNNILLHDDGSTGSDDTLVLLHTYPINHGRQIITLKNNKTHTITAKLDINASSWLIYNRFNPNAKYNYFAVKFLAKPRWKGVGEFHKQTEANASQINHYRINW